MGDANTQPPAEPPTESAEAARERRLRAIRSLAADQGATASDERIAQRPSLTRRDADVGDTMAAVAPGSARLPRQRQQKRHRRGALWAGVVVALCVAVVAAGALYVRSLSGRGAHAHATSPTISSFIFNMRQGQTTCFTDAAWSPDSTEVAVLGNASACPILDFSTNVPYISINTVVQVFHIAGGPVTQFKPDAFVHIPNAAITQFENLLWSPDGKQIALTFVAETLVGDPAAGPPLIAPVAAGVLLVDADGSHPHVLSQPSTTVNPSFGPITNGFLLTSEEWDLTTGKVIAQLQSQPTDGAYRWGASGALIPLTSAVPQAIGLPDGGASFTIWQPGAIQLGLNSPNSTSNGQVQVVPGLDVWGANFGAWSPDGRYLYAPFSIARRIHLANQPIPPTTIPNEITLDTNLTTFPHDRALTTLDSVMLQLAKTSMDPTQAFYPTISLAWRPDGRVVAAQPQIGAGMTNVTLYDCATGRALAQLAHEGTQADVSTASQPLLRWSPDGKSLALTNSAYNTLTIWTFSTPLK